ncbi:hypothetical protein EDD18DRAFT_37154 [Armillaria luteobubalina]|uniref:Secreted protein n=1 Tax=Armillaria luteobubalina TaxID=153913 RepID=A0AA39QRL0_9AGAR|nr:hypothetical protein EDD18DRAFT_37154 [Armillaria luteobubalina]
MLATLFYTVLFLLLRVDKHNGHRCSRFVGCNDNASKNPTLRAINTTLNRVILPTRSFDGLITVSLSNAFESRICGNSIRASSFEHLAASYTGAGKCSRPTRRSIPQSQ